MNLQVKTFILILLLSTFSCNRKTEILNQAGKKQTTSVEPKSLKEQEIIIEGTVISANRGFAHKSLHSSCIVEVNTIFKGEIKEKVIEVFVNGGSVGTKWQTISSGQIILPKINQTAIFRLVKVEKDHLHKDLIGLSPFGLYFGIGKVQLLYSDKNYRLKNSNIEKNVYQKLEKESGRKRQIVLPPATQDEVAINFSTNNNGLTVPNRKKGLIYKATPIQENKMEGHIGFNILISSSNIACYLHKGELIIQYNPKVFGDSIISKGLLQYEIPRNYDRGNSSWYFAIPKSWDATISDIDHQSFKIKWWDTTNSDQCLQLLPGSNGIYAARLYLKPKEMHQPMAIRLIAPDSTNLRYDYNSNSNVPFEYIATQDVTNYQALNIMPSIITKISPNTSAQIRDTIQLSGKYFGNYVRIYLSSIGTSGNKRYKRIPKSHILSKSDTLLKFIIPYQTLGDNEQTQEWSPVTGKIKLVKGYGKFEMMTWSDDELVIQE